MIDIRTLSQADAIEYLRQTMPRLIRVQTTAVQQAEGSAIDMIGIDPASGVPFPEIVYTLGGGDIGEGVFAPPTGITTPATREFDPTYPGGVFGQYWADYDLAGNLLRIRFQKSERHGGFISENLDVIGPLAVSAFAFFAPSLLAPYTVASEVATTAAGSTMWNDYDLITDIGFDPTVNIPPGEILDFPQIPGGEYFSDIFTPEMPVGPPSSPATVPPSSPPVNPGPGWTMPDIGAIGREIIGSGAGILKDATAAARNALTLVQTVRAIQNGGNGYSANGSQRIVSANGTVTEIGPDGRRRTTQTRPGVAEQTLDGGFVVNNGDGTYTRVGPDGRRQTLRYSGGGFQSPIGGGFSAPGGANQWLLIGGAALAAVVIARSLRK